MQTDKIVREKTQQKSVTEFRDLQALLSIYITLH